MLHTIENETGLVARANKAFRRENFSEALSLYRMASKSMGFDVFNINIQKCLNALRERANKYQTSRRSSSLNSYFDHVYLVNLPSHTQRLSSAVKQLKNHNVDFELIEAVNGYEGEPLEKYQDYASKPLGTLNRFEEFNKREITRGKHFIESAGAFGYIYTYLNILRDAKKESYKKFLILEDDVILSNFFETDLKKFMASISDDWKIVQLGASQYGWGSVNEELALDRGWYEPRLLDTCGSFAIGIDSDIIDELIIAESAFDGPFDHLAMGEIYEKYLGKCFVAFPNIVMPDVSDSSIRGARDQMMHAEMMKWDIGRFKYPLERLSVALILNTQENLKYFSQFDEFNKLPIDLRLYYFTEDGLRPLHAVEQAKYIKMKPSLDLVLPNVDVCIEVKKETQLTEKHLVESVYAALNEDRAILEWGVVKDFRKRRVVEGRVSVIVPTHKRPGNLMNAMVSVLEQDYIDVELVVVNDSGSSEPSLVDTRDVVYKCKSKFPHHKIIYIEHKMNRNGAAARNTGFMASTGEYICFLDDDDVYLPGRIAKSIKGLICEETDVVCCGFIGWNSPVNDLSRYETNDLYSRFLSLQYKTHYIHTNTVTYKRSVIEKLNGFDESYPRHQDLEFNLRVLSTENVMYVKEALVRLNPEPSGIDNKAYGADMIYLKEKFLGQFLNSGNVCEDEMEKVMLAHHAEVDRYVSLDYELKNRLVSEENSFIVRYLLSKIEV